MWPRLRPYDISTFADELEASQRNFLISCISDLVKTVPLAPKQSKRPISASTQRGLLCLTRKLAPDNEVLELLREYSASQADSKGDTPSSPTAQQDKVIQSP